MRRRRRRRGGGRRRRRRRDQILTEESTSFVGGRRGEGRGAEYSGVTLNILSCINTVLLFEFGTERTVTLPESEAD